jgi:Kef-type K+ transport system membrane component KefB
MVGGMVLCVVTGVSVALMVMNAVAPGAIPAMVGLAPWPASTVALAMAVLAAATSPAVAIAVVNSTGARGPVSNTVLTTVVAGEVTAVLLFSAVSSLVLSVLGLAGDVTVVDTLVGVGLSVLLGAAVGALIAAYLRYVAVDVALFLVAVVYASTFVLQEFHGEAALVFICAGFVVGNLSTQGEALIHEVERLTRPVYVVFFALAGAKLHLDVLLAMLVPALCVFAVRLGAVRFGARAGARLARAPEAVQQYAWMGLVSQAGMAIALANQSRTLLPAPIGDGVFSMAIAVIALNELVGPTVLQAGLSRAGEIAGAPAGKEAGERPVALVEEGEWRERVVTGHERLDAVLGDSRATARSGSACSGASSFG